MASALSWESLDVHLLHILYVLLSEASVSRAARRLHLSQPAVSMALKRLRKITGDKLLVRARDGMVPTERGAQLLDPVRSALEQLERIGGAGAGEFRPDNLQRCFNVASPDYLNAGLLAEVVADVHCAAPGARLMFHSMTQGGDYPKGLETGELDIVIGNWPDPPEHLRTKPLFEDRMVVMLRDGHPLAQTEVIDCPTWLAAEHLAPTPYAVGQRGVVDVFLARERLQRNVIAHVPYFHLAPYMLLTTDLIFTAPERFARHYAAFLPLTVCAAPPELPTMSYYLLWHERSHDSSECRWLRDRIVDIARA